mgnify:CR=1 FL=1
MDKRYAVLIDADNVSEKYIKPILDEISNEGVITYKRIYGDWTRPALASWKQALLNHSITPIQQYSYTTGKNSTDSAMIIDAMDILYSHNVDGFCIVSSDSDFTRLASRLRESGMQVIGMGEEKTPRSFRAACSVFTTLEVLVDQDDAPDAPAMAPPARPAETAMEEEPSRRSGLIHQRVIEADIAAIISENDDKDKPTGLGELGSRLVKKYSDFDVRNYGYSSLSKFLEEMDAFELSKSNSAVTVRLRDRQIPRKELDACAVELVRQNGKSGMRIETLGRKLNDRFEQFNVKDYGYTTLARFVESVEGLEIRPNRAGNRVVQLKK